MNRLSLWLAYLDERLPRGWKMALVALILIAVATHYFSLSLSTPIYFVVKLTLGAVVGYCADRMAFPHDRVHEITDPVLKGEAYRRRAVIVGAAMVAAGVSA